MFSVISSVKNVVIKSNYGATVRLLQLSVVNDAARKGTREKARKKKVKVEVQKVGFIPHNLRSKKIDVSHVNKHIDDSWKQIPNDNVYVGRYYRWKVYSVAEAIQCHRETHHPSMYNIPDAPVHAQIELNMFAEKTTRYVDNFSRMAAIPHKFDHGELRQILVFTKDPEEYTEAQNAGATLVGGLNLIKDIQNGDLLLADYQYVIAHPNILPDLVVLRGLMKKKFPNPKSGTLGANLTEMIERFSNGVCYAAAKDEYQKDFGLIMACIGKLDMATNHLEANLEALLKDIDSMRPKREGKFITRVLLKSPPSREQLKIDPFVYVVEERHGKSVKKANEEEVEIEKQEAVN